MNDPAVSRSAAVAESPDDGATSMTSVRVDLPGHLCTLAGVSGEQSVPVTGEVTIGAILDAVERRFPVLAGTIRGHHAGERRPYVRFFAGGQDLSFLPYSAVVPPAVADGSEPFLVVGAVAGG